VTTSPASGERAALRGYRWQYDHIAALVYDALIEDDFVSLRLTDPSAGKVDDLVLVTRDSVNGYQFKSSEFDGFITFRQILANQHTRSGQLAPSFVQALADGWTLLRQQHDVPVRVHLVSQLFASTSDHLADASASDRPSADHFQAFIAQVIEPLRRGSLSLSQVPAFWAPAVARLRAGTGLAVDAFAVFAQAMHLHLGTRGALPPTKSTRWSDIIALSDKLYRTVSHASAVVQLNRQQLLDLMGWTHRPRLQSSHDFPVDLDTYAPLEQAIVELDDGLAAHTRGYVAIIGPPGAGKSTLLSQALSGRPERIVRYYAYVPGVAGARGRLTAQGFLHDLVIMLDRAGLRTAERQLVSSDARGLRSTLHEQLDGAGREFSETGRRTVIVVDGLDHVERDLPGSDGLLGELPAPYELPDGVLVIVGTRTLSPLKARARQQLEDDATVINLEHHRLSTSAVLEICQRAPVTSELEPDVHERIADLSSGHPLALSYLLNRLRDRDSGDDPLVVLADAPAYTGNIAAEYRIVWDDVENNADLVSMLAVCSRLRVGFTTEWLETWAPASAVTTFRRELRYLFRRLHDGWHFFHDSFRQFATDHTAFDDDGRFDVVRDAAQHRRIADLCSASIDSHIAWEEFYHRHCAGQQDDVIALARQELFRDQACSLRSLEAIRTDIGLALRTYADQCNIRGLVAMLLAASEVDNRESVLEQVDLPGALYNAGLVDEAIGSSGGELGRQVPLAYAYHLAERLGRDGRPEGRRIFDLVEHHLFDDSESPRIAGREDEVAQAWGAAAPRFRPLGKVLSATRLLLMPDAVGGVTDRFDERHSYRRHTTIMQAVIDTLAEQRRTDGLLVVDAELADRVDVARPSRPQRTVGSNLGGGSRNDPEEWIGQVAALIALRIQLRIALVAQSSTIEDVERYVDEAIALLDGSPYFYFTALDVAELAARYGRDRAAAELLQHSPYENMLTVSSLGYSGEPNAIDRCFRYWRLRFLLAHRGGNTTAGDAARMLTSIPPEAATPAGNSIALNAPVHSDTPAIELAQRIDTTVRTLARLDASIVTQTSPTPAEIWTKLLAALEVFRSAARVPSSSSYQGILQQQRTPLMLLVIALAVRMGAGLPDKLVETLALRFSSQPKAWPLSLRLELATELRRAEVNVTWYENLLIAREHESSQADVVSRLQELAVLIQHYADDGDLMQAARLAHTLVPMAFGVGYRKDYQFSTWVEWLGRALDKQQGSEMVAEAVWLARLIVAAEPMTEGGPGLAAADLPAAVTVASPISAVRLFEFLTRQGTARHMKVLSELMNVLVAKQDGMGIQLAADFMTEVIAAASNEAYPELANNIAKTYKALGIAKGTELVTQCANRISYYALPTTRAEWRCGLGLPPRRGAQSKRQEERSDEYGALLLNDGRRILRTDVAAMVPDIESVVALRSAEAPESKFRWASLITGMTLSGSDITLLEDVFDDLTEDSLAVLVILAEQAHRNNAVPQAARLASNVLEHSQRNSWSSHWGATRRRAHGVAIASGGHQERLAAFRDLADQIAESSWLASSLIDELDDVIAVLDPSITADTIWPIMRQHLDGIAETLRLPPDDVLESLACRWWLPGFYLDQRAAVPRDTPTSALAELAVAHLSHPTWIIRDGTSRVVVRALKADNSEVAQALSRFAQPDAADDILEVAGRCLAAARQNPNYTTPECLTLLEHTLMNHNSQILRDLAPAPMPNRRRPLPGRYRLELPGRGDEPLIGRPRSFLAPHENQYRMLAEGLDLNLDTIYAIADEYAAHLLETLPSKNDIHSALAAADLNHTFPSEMILAARGAFGRVVADLTDAGLLDNIPWYIRRKLRTVDIDLIDISPEPRPTVLPPAPDAGHDQTTQVWLDVTDVRLSEYVEAATGSIEFLLGAEAQISVLNWDHPQEEFSCGTSVGSNSPAAGESLFQPAYRWVLHDLVAAVRPVADLPKDDLLLMSNNGWTFHQLSADWISFRPDVAAALDWTPVPQAPGSWLTAEGETAVRAVWWVDGWWGRAGPAFDDTDGEGWAVVVSAIGLAQLTAQFGPLTRVFRLSRWGRQDGKDSEQVIAVTHDELAT
jgi:hypothetical protein